MVGSSGRTFRRGWARNAAVEVDATLLQQASVRDGVKSLYDAACSAMPTLGSVSRTGKAEFTKKRAWADHSKLNLSKSLSVDGQSELSHQPAAQLSNLARSLTEEHVEMLSPLQLALVTWSLAKLRDKAQGSMLLHRNGSLSHALERQAARLDSKALAMVLWAFATTTSSNPQLTSSLAMEALPKISESSVQSITNVLWSCATCRYLARPLFAAVEASMILNEQLNFNSQHVANITWAIAASSVDASELYGQMVASALKHLDEFRSVEMAAMAWAMAIYCTGGDNKISSCLLYPIAERAIKDVQSSSRLLVGSVWALSKVAAGNCELWDRLASVTSRRVSTFDSQEVANASWAFATISCRDASAFAALSDAAQKHLFCFRPQELSTTAWAFAAVRHFDGMWVCKLSKGIEERINELPLRCVAALAWAWATHEADSTLFDATLLPASVRLIDQLVRKGISSGDLSREVIDPVLQIAWASTFRGVRHADFLSIAELILRKIGRTDDRNARIKYASKHQHLPVSMGVSAGRHQHIESIPRVVRQQDDLIFVLKPPNWEIDGGKIVNARMAPRRGVKQVSKFLCTLFPDRPILNDTRRGSGLLGRLDAPSSGLVLCALSHECYLYSRLVQETFAVEREYVVLCHGSLEGKMVELAAPILAIPGESSKVQENGLPAITRIAPVAWLRSRPTTSHEYQLYTLVVVSIVTGRKHQIRCHLAHAGHPVVCDERYAPHLFAADTSWCPRNFLHRYRLAVPAMLKGVDLSRSRIQDNVRNSYVEANAPLPSDLRDALSKLEPVSSDSAAVKHVWMTDECPASYSRWSSSVLANDWRWLGKAIVHACS